MKKELVINLDTLREICGEEKSFIIEMIDLFLQQAESYISDIEEAITNRDDELVKKKAHKFKSSAQIFGISNLYDMLLKIECEGLLVFKLNDKDSVIRKMKIISDLACEQLKEEKKKFI
jgi:HPt (histidine-containing phosphotransfer) domain-containing protein